ncbi:unnamed protein product, partial [Prunus brigantina]
MKTTKTKMIKMVLLMLTHMLIFLLARLQCVALANTPRTPVLPTPFSCVKALQGGFSHANQINQINHINHINHKSGSGLGMRFWRPCTAGGRGGNLSGHGSIIKPDAMLPNEIIRYVVEDGDVREAAELQWKAMVEDMYLKQQQQQMQGQGLGKFKNCLAVCHINHFMGIRARELAVITSGHLPDLLLHSIEGDDLKSKCEFMMRTCSSKLGSYVHNWKIWDVILEVAVKENLKAEQMVKKVFVFTDFGYGGGTFLKTLYEAKQSEFKEQGYGDNAVPHILVWNIGYWNKLCIEEHHPGVTLLSGFSENLLKSFLDNGGEIGRCHLMEAAIADKEYQALSVTAAEREGKRRGEREGWDEGEGCGADQRSVVYLHPCSSYWDRYHRRHENGDWFVEVSLTRRGKVSLAQEAELKDEVRITGGYKSFKKEVSDISDSVKKKVCESKKRANEIILKDMEERLKKQQEAMEESIASLRSESKVAVETKEDAANLCELVKLKPWKVKLLIHDSAHSHVKKGIRETATKAGPRFLPPSPFLTCESAELWINNFTFLGFSFTNSQRLAASSLVSTATFVSDLREAMDSSMASSCFFNISSMSFNIISLAPFFDSQTSFLTESDMSETSFLNDLYPPVILT